MKRSRFGWLAVAAASLVVASLAATVDASAASSATLAPSARQSTGTVGVRFAVKKFVAQGKSLYAVGDVIGTFASADGTQGMQVTHTPFKSKVKRIKAGSASARHLQQANRICDILSLNLAPLRLELLGLIVELDAVVLTIKADSNGGLLGGLLCGLAGSSGLPSLPTAAAGLTKAAKKSGLAAGPGFQVPVSAVTMSPPATTSSPRQLVGNPGLAAGAGRRLHGAGSAPRPDRSEPSRAAGAPQPHGAADHGRPDEGPTGSLLCSLAGGVPTPITTPTG